MEIWEALPGEIDFDSVLVASALRLARPDLFVLVDLLRHGLRDPFSPQDGEAKPSKVVKRIEENLVREDERAAAAMRTLLRFLFPRYPTAEEQKGGPPVQGDDRGYISRPQTMFVDRHADYWRRYLAQTPVSATESDQGALAAIRAWRDRTTTDLIDRVVDPQRAHQIESFVGQFRPSDLRRLLCEVADRVSTNSAAGWGNGGHAPGVAAVWGMMLVKRPPKDVVYHTVLEIVQRYVSIHLPLATDVAYFFASKNPRVPQLMSDAQQEQVTQQLRDALAAHFTGDGAEERLAIALKDGSPWLIYWIVSRGQNDAYVHPFDRWRDFSSVLLGLAESRPAIGVPLVVALITKTNLRSGLRQDETGEVVPEERWIGTFDTEGASRLFDYPRLLKVLSKFDMPDHLDVQMMASCRAAVDVAQAEVDRP